MKRYLTCFVTLLILMDIAWALHKYDPDGICEESGGFPDAQRTVCCRASCKSCDNMRSCGKNGGNPWCCVTTIAHNQGLCADPEVTTAPCVRSEIRIETGGFAYDPSGEYEAKPNPAGDLPGWRSTGFVVQLHGEIKYTYDSSLEYPNMSDDERAELDPVKFLARVGTRVGKLTGTYGDSFCPIADQTFGVTNGDGLSVSILVTKMCEIYVESWALHILYYNADEHQFKYIENFNKTFLQDGGPDIVIKGVNDDAISLSDMAYFDLSGITYIGNFINQVQFGEEIDGPDKMDPPQIPQTNEHVYTVPELIHGLWTLCLTLFVILSQCKKCYYNQQTNSNYDKVQVHYVDETTDIDIK